MAKTELVKKLIKAHILQNRPLVLLGCEEEVEAYQSYLEQLKSDFEAMPLEVLEGKVKSLREAS